MSENTYYKGTILRVNLSTKEITREQFNGDDLRKYIGGPGLGLKMLYDEVPPGTKPADPENKLFFCAGPLSGTRVMGSGNYTVCTRGGVTGLLTSAQANGFFGARMRQTGNDIIAIEGVSDEWCYVSIVDDKVEIKSADHLVGKSPNETQDILKGELDKNVTVAAIGVAGENLLPIANISGDYRHRANTNGPGMPMGAKKLKCIAIVAKNNVIEYPDEDSVKSFVKNEFFKRSMEHALAQAVDKCGTTSWFDLVGPGGGVAIKNYTSNVSDTLEKLSVPTYLASLEFRKRRPCYNCPMHHGYDISFKEGSHAGETFDEIEYEMMAAFSLNIGSDDPSFAAYMCSLMEEYGVDGKEIAWSVALVYDCFEHGVITTEDTGGMSFMWGETQDLPELVDQICTRRGFGATFSDGVKIGSERIGGKAVDMAVWVGAGNAPHVTDDRGLGVSGFLPTYACSDNGSFYGSQSYDPENGNDEAPGLFDYDAIPKSAKNDSVKWMYMDMVGLCMFFAQNKAVTVEAINEVTGWDMTGDELYEAGDRVRALARSYNILCGRTREDDRVSTRMSMANVDGPAKGQNLAESLPGMIDKYLEASEYDVETGKPTPELLTRLGLEFLIADLWPERVEA